MESLIRFIKRPFQVKKEKGITLLEILAVLVIIALVFIALSRNLGFGSDKAKTTDVQQAFKPYQVAFENSMNEYSGIPTSNIDLDGAGAGVLTGDVPNLSIVDRYLGVDYKTNATAPVNGTTTQAVANSAINSVLKDPWNANYKVQGKVLSTTESLLVVKTSGKSKTMNADLFYYPLDADDIVFVTHFKNGQVKSCTAGLEKNIGTITNASNLITGCQ